MHFHKNDMSRRQISDVRSLWCLQLAFCCLFVFKSKMLIACCPVHARLASCSRVHLFTRWRLTTNIRVFIARGNSHSREANGIISVCKNINDAISKDRWDKSGQLRGRLKFWSNHLRSVLNLLHAQRQILAVMLAVRKQ